MVDECVELPSEQEQQEGWAEYIAQFDDPFWRDTLGPARMNPSRYTGSLLSASCSPGRDNPHSWRAARGLSRPSTFYGLSLRDLYSERSNLVAAQRYLTAAWAAAVDGDGAGDPTLLRLAVMAIIAEVEKLDGYTAAIEEHLDSDWTGCPL